MSYRGIKRVLGETHLERKCRLLFGACLLLVTLVPLAIVGLIVMNRVYETRRVMGARLVDSYMLTYHWVHVWENREELKGWAQQISDDLQLQKYEARFLALEETNTPAVGLPADDVEREILLRLRQELAWQQTEEARRAQRPPPPETSPWEEDDPLDFLPIFEERTLTDEAGGDGYYVYYQPIYWRRSCGTVGCHQPKTRTGALPAAEAGTLLDDNQPFRVVKVVIPDQEMRRAIHWTWAILFVALVVIVFGSMLGLYMIVRYVIVKPLTHLRDVSDEISRGSTSLRADIHTGDEFEDLAASFNRMLRSLVDAQEELRKVNANLDLKVDELAKANMQLYEMNRLKSDFLASMSHELRTPLNSIIGFSEVLHGIDALSEKQMRYVKNIQKSGRVLLDMINDILDLAKMESGKMEVRPSEFHVGAVVSAQCDMVRSLTEGKNIDLECDVPAGLPPMFQDQGKVQQILTNLLSNAIKFTPEGGRITVAVRRGEDQMLRLSVADTGVGIAEEDREVIFEKFRQSTTKVGGALTREHSGTGLGLSIVKELCILLGGEVSFESELGKGSTFLVRLPWNLAHEGQERAAAGMEGNGLRPRRRDAAHDAAPSM